MIWRFYINDTEIDEPLGFSDISLTVKRDPVWKGMIFEASTSPLGFYKEAFDLLYNLKRSYGIDATAIFRAEVKCEGESEYTEAIRGRLNFGQYIQTCGTDCIIRMPVEQDDCTMTLRNRYDQKVNIDSNISFNKQTVLQDYDKLGFTMELATQNIPVSAEGYVGADGDRSLIEDIPVPITGSLLIRPIYSNLIDASIETTQLADPANFFETTDGFSFISPQVLIQDSVKCSNGSYDYNVRLKGTFKHTYPDDEFNYLDAMIIIWNGLGELLIDGTVIDTERLITEPTPGETYDFDYERSGNIDIAVDSGVYVILRFHVISGPFEGMSEDVFFDSDTHFLLSSVRICPPTESEVYAVHELFSRAVEAVTDRCLTVKSDYYGRTDSQPYAAAQDGCGSLRVLTNGLKIRQAENNNLSMSVKDIFEGLNGIDNIGMGVEGNQLRVESAEYFFQDNKIIDIPLIPESDINLEESRIYSVIKTGYKKWETQSVKGLDEFNSNKEFRTGLKSVNNPLDITSAFVAAGYVIEQIRTQLFSTTGRADNGYDNDTFIISVDRSYGSFIVEQGNISSPANIFSPETAYNWRIRPLYNLMRWAKSIFHAYPNINDSLAKIFFSSGTGNYVAEGELTDGCKWENKPLAENDDLSVNDFLQQLIPLLSTDDISFTYPLSAAEYKIIKANPYGYINLQCGTGDFWKAYIQEINYQPSKGEASFTLSLKWQYES